MRLALPRGRKLFLGLAHFSLRPAGSVPARSFHVFYTFAARPPFEVLGLGRPFTLPSEMRLTQVATGLLLRGGASGSATASASLLVSYAEHECEPRLASMPLAEVLADLELAGHDRDGGPPVESKDAD